MIRTNAISWAAIAYALAGVTSLVAQTQRPGLGELLRPCAMPLITASLAVLAPAELARVKRAALGGGFAALGLGLVAYAATLLSPDPTLADHLRVSVTTHHLLFDELPRFSGTFDDACQALGEYALVFLALLPALSDRPRLPLFGLALGSVALLATFSSAWLGLPVVLLASAWSCGYRVPRGFFCAAIAASCALCLACCWLMNFGLPERALPVGARYLEAPCSALDLEHYVTAVQPPEYTNCRQALQRWPYPARLSDYREAKQLAIAAFLRAPLFGVGAGRFRQVAARAAERRFGQATELVSQYHSPHSTPLGAAAEQGLFGLAALVALVLAVLRKARHLPPSELSLWVAAAALLAIGLNADLLHRRYVWLLLGLIAAPPATPQPRLAMIDAS